MIINNDISVRISSADIDDKNPDIEILNKAVSAFISHSLTEVSFDFEGVTFKFKEDEVSVKYINQLLINDENNIAPLGALCVLYLQENGSSLHLIAPNIDITFLNFKKDAEIDFEGASDHYIECEMIQRKVGESHEPDEIYEAFKTALDEKDYDALDSLVETAQQVFSDDEESTRKISKKKKDKSKTKRKIAKASRRKNRK